MQAEAMHEREYWYHMIAKAAGLKLAVLSNELDLFYGPEMRKKRSFLDDCVMMVDATFTKILKPDPRAYDFATEALGVSPQDCVFVDDQPKNVSSGAEFGIAVHQCDVIQPGNSDGEARFLLGI